MFTFRPTAKLAMRLGARPLSDQGPPTTCLGDWYGNLLRIGHRQLILCTSDRSLLSVVLPAKDAKGALYQILPVAVESLLHAIGVPEERTGVEMQAMLDSVVGKPVSRSVLGSMNDLAFGLTCRYEATPDAPLEELALELSNTRCSPLGSDSPCTVARRLLTE